jgi:hypothetical protein
MCIERSLCGADHRFLWSVWEGLRPAKFHEKAARTGAFFAECSLFGAPLCSLTSVGFSTLPARALRRRQKTIVCATRERNQSVQLNASRRSETSPCGRHQKDPFHPPPANEAHFRGAARPDIPANAPFLASSISCSLSGKYTPLDPIFSHSVKATRYHLRASLCFPKAR